MGEMGPGERPAESMIPPEFLRTEVESNWRFIQEIERQAGVTSEVSQKSKGLMTRLRRGRDHEEKARQIIEKELEKIPPDAEADCYVYRPKLIDGQGKHVPVLKALLLAKMIPPQAKKAAEEYSEKGHKPLGWGRAIARGEYAFSAAVKQDPRENTLGESAKAPNAWLGEIRRLRDNPEEQLAVMSAEEFFLLLAKAWHDKGHDKQGGLALAGEKGTIFPDENYEGQDPDDVPCIRFDPKTQTYETVHVDNREQNENNGVRFIRLSGETGVWKKPRIEI